MSQDEYSTYDAKARFSEVLRKVREGRTVTITYHGEPVAELRPLKRVEGVDDRFERLRERGVITKGKPLEGRLRPLVRRPGALKRFLEDRNE